VMGEFLPLDKGLIPPKAQAMWWQQQGLQPGSPIRAIDYWKKGVTGWIEEGGDGRLFRNREPVAPLFKGGSARSRALDDAAFEYSNLSHGEPGGLSSVDFTRLYLSHQYREQPKK